MLTGTLMIRFISFAFFPLLMLAESLHAETPALNRIREILTSGEKQVRMVAFGDSVTGLYYHTGGRQAYGELLVEAIQQIRPESDLTLINAGRSGHSTANALGRIGQDVLAHKPHLVTVMFGLNDVAKLPIEAYRKNLVEIVRQCRARGAEVILCTPNAVLTTPERPLEKVFAYSEVTRAVAREMTVPLCDTYREMDALKARDPETWRLSMSDEIHPNFGGHRRLAESLAQTITGQKTTLEDKGPAAPHLGFTMARLKAGDAVKILAMPPFDTFVGEALRERFPGANVGGIPWPTEGLSRYLLMKDAAHRVRPLTPTLVFVAIPRSATADGREQFIRTQMWIASNSLSRGKREWDVVVVHPSVFEGEPTEEETDNDALIRRIVVNQDLPLLDRAPGDPRGAEEILREWLSSAAP
ncbi:MAG: SGNH/GDSL hydrolase family protein [Verrucomicrobiales bacterium]|jgi:lysophospholipase L1-like esterase|nr:SGNH/GDSL hydrolase family protein [Verrucomicrobiales bacterium]MDP4790931.1 SGNH/GDSL hydrolase family protein [Verrucomicrobiales bacterium]MDP4938053.1 SGNH/GDSL hydrolase family protein [Verrucomicrobiales bacterium]MDP5007092.1 SGNH/GDSL hydrolase family protein [Verrucomicrobiales bacterium]